MPPGKKRIRLPVEGSSLTGEPEPARVSEQQDKPQQEAVSTPAAQEAEPSSEPPRLDVYAAEVISARLERMIPHIDGVRRSEETEPVHQMRVWSRRSRAALEVFDACFDSKEYRKVEAEVKAVTDALGEARDLDVMIETLTAREEKLPPDQRAGLESFIEKMRQRRGDRQEAVRTAVARLERRDLVRRFQVLAEERMTCNLHAGKKSKGGSHG